MSDNQLFIYVEVREHDSFETEKIYDVKKIQLFILWESLTITLKSVQCAVRATGSHDTSHDIMYL